MKENIIINSDKSDAIKLLKVFIIGVCLIFTFLATLYYINSEGFFPPFIILFSGALTMAISYFLISKKKYLLAKFIVSVLPPYFILIASLITKSHDVFSNVYTFLTPRFLVLLYVMVPIIIFGTYQKKYLIISLLILSPNVLLFEYFHTQVGVNLVDLEYVYSFHPIFIIMSSVFLGFSFISILLFQKNNQRYRQKILKNNKKINDEKEKIAILNSNLEYQSNLYKVLDIASKSKQLFFILQEVLEEIMSITSLTDERKGLIFITNTNGDLEIAAHKNVDTLFSTCSIIKKGQCLCGEVLESKKKIFCDSVGHNHTIIPEGMRPHGHYVTPILHQEDVMGVINIYIKEGEEKDQKIEDFLEGVASILSRKIVADKVEEKLKLKNIELDFSKNVVEKTNLELKETYKELDESIAYAEFMQKSLIPNSETLDVYFKESGIFFSPKDRVSGDFYFAHDMGDLLYFGVADCTGHGIPGSFLAAMSTEALKSVILNLKNAKPNIILEELRIVAKERFSINFGDKRSDSMDASICMYDKKEETICFSGGFSDLIIVRGNAELIEIKGTKCPVGSYPIEPMFEIHHLKLQKGDVIYLSTDGFVDQFGHVEGREKPAKYKKKRFRELILKINHLDCKTQVEILEKTLNKWRGNLEQIDDVTVFVAKH